MCPFNASESDNIDDNCVVQQKRDIYGGGGFPNCAATVGDGSRCVSNDACVTGAVNYEGFRGGCSVIDCKYAWR